MVNEIHSCKRSTTIAIKPDIPINSAIIRADIIKNAIGLPKGNRFFIAYKIVSPVARVYLLKAHIPIKVKIHDSTTVQIRDMPHRDPADAMVVTLPVPIL